jgi:type II secretory pathway predicted ATPase ExeA
MTTECAHPNPQLRIATSMSYLRHWKLDRSPYRPEGEAYPAPPQQEALARIDYLASEHRPLGALVAPRGMGKSIVLCEAKRQRVRDGRYTAEVDAFGMTPREWLWQVACGFDAQPTLGDSVSRLWQRLADTAAEHAWRRETGMVLVDDAGQAGPDLCQQFVRLARVAGTAGAAWTVVLAATPEESSRWPETLLELIDLRIELYAWDEDTTVDYLQHALMSAGRLEPVFTEDALRLLHSLSHGVPRQVARLADFAMVVGAASSVAIIDTGIVESAAHQVAWPTKVAG